MNTYNIGAAAAGVVKFFTRGNAYRKSAAIRAVKSLGSAVFGTVKALLCVIAVIGVILSVALILVMPLSGERRPRSDASADRRPAPPLRRQHEENPFGVL
jgi:hypothetical protein